MGFQPDSYLCRAIVITLPETNMTSPLKMDGWNTILYYWVSAYFQGRTVSFREGNINMPSDSIRDLLIPKRWRSPTTFEFGSLNHPKKGTSRIAR